jgi:hypothetical protein
MAHWMLHVPFRTHKSFFGDGKIFQLSRIQNLHGASRREPCSEILVCGGDSLAKVRFCQDFRRDRVAARLLAAFKEKSDDPNQHRHP